MGEILKLPDLSAGFMVYEMLNLLSLSARSPSLQSHASTSHLTGTMLSLSIPSSPLLPFHCAAASSLLTSSTTPNPALAWLT